MSRDFYKILDLDRNCTKKDVRKQYMILSKIYHPDKNPTNKKEAEEKFKDIAEAYSVLSDPEKKKLYDQFGEEGLKQNGHVNINPDEIFAHIFGQQAANGLPGFMFHHSMGGGQPNVFDMFNNRKRKSKSVNYNLFASLEELHSGKIKKMKITKKVNGKPVTKVLEIPIKRGMKPGCKFTFSKEGDQIQGMIPGDIVFTLQEKPHKFFKRENENLIFKSKITVEQALKGFELEIPCIDEENTTEVMKIEPLKCSDYEKLLFQKGIFNSKTRRRGNLIVKFNVLFK